MEDSCVTTVSSVVFVFALIKKPENELFSQVAPGLYH